MLTFQNVVGRRTVSSKGQFSAKQIAHVRTVEFIINDDLHVPHA